MSKTNILKEFGYDYTNEYYYTTKDYSYNPIGRENNNPCETCMNNPKNNPHASGVCNCALPALLNPMF